MSFKIKNTEIKISFTFFALILIFISVNNFKMYFLTLIFGLIHELVHLFFIYRLSLPPKKITFTLFGANITRNSNTSLKSLDEFIINISAPLFNIFIGIIIQLTINNKTENTENIITINLLLGFFNLMPYYNFDGGNALRCLLLLKTDKEFTEQVLTITSICVTVVFAILTFIVFTKYKYNFSFAVITIYFLLNLVFKK